MILERIKNNKATERVTNWYGRYERPISSLSLVLGFVFDALTLRRVDAFWENLWVVAHILIIAVFIVLVHSVKAKPGDEATPGETHFWLVNILQFVFGGLLSIFLVFYFRSADLSVSWPFILLLALAFWANESLKRHFVRLTFQLSLFYLSLFVTLIYIVPVVLHRIGGGVFIISGLLSLIFMIIFLNIVIKYSREKYDESRPMVLLSIGGIFVALNILYFTNIMPPIPLSLKDSGVFHSILKDDAEGYTAQYEDLGWRGYLQIYPDFHESTSGAVFAYSAVFSPSELNITIIHQWQYYDNVLNEWVDYDKVSLPVVGGREEGFRTYSVKEDLEAGKWRVNVETQGGQVIGRLRFNVVKSATSPVLVGKVLD